MLRACLAPAWVLAGCQPASVAVSDGIAFEQVEMRRPDGTLVQATQATAAPDGTGRAVDVKLSRPASGAPALEITAPRSTWDLKAQTAHFEGGVVVMRADVELRCAALDVAYASVDRLERAVASGAVEVRSGARRASGATAVLTTATGEIVLTGSPTVTEGANTMTGSTIRFLLDDERVECEDCRLVVDGAAVAPRPR